MGTRFSRLALDILLAISVLAMLKCSPIVIASHQTLPNATVQLPTLPRRQTYHNFQYYLDQWLAESVPHIAIEQGESSTSLTVFDPLPSVYAATITRVQGNVKGSWSSGTSFGIALSSAPGNGDTLVAVIGTDSNSGGVSTSVNSISETGATWTRAVSKFNGSYMTVEIWYALNVSSASQSITVNLSGSPGWAVADICEYSGILTSSALDVVASNSGSGYTTDTGSTITTSQGIELWVGGTDEYAVSQSNPTHGFVVLDGTLNRDSLAYLENIVTSTGTANSGTSTTLSGAWSGAIATFKGITGPPPGDFSISLSPTSQNVGAGGAASSTLTIAAGLGFSGTVGLSVTAGCPSGVTCSVSPNSINASGTATVTVPTLITSSGTFSVVVTATSGLLNHQTTFTVTVTPPASFSFNVQSTSVQVVVTVTWVGTGTASVTIVGPGGTPTMSESGGVVYNRISYVSGASSPTNIHRVTFTLSTPPAGVWTAYVSQSGATVTIEVN